METIEGTKKQISSVSVVSQPLEERRFRYSYTRAFARSVLRRLYIQQGLAKNLVSPFSFQVITFIVLPMRRKKSLSHSIL